MIPVWKKYCVGSSLLKLNDIFLLLPTYSGIIPAREILLPSGVLFIVFFFQELRRLNFEYWWEVDCLGVMLFTFTRHHPTYNSSYNFIHTHMRARLHYLAEKYIFFSYVACCRVLSIFSLRLYCVSLSYDPVYIFSFGQ